MKKNIIRIILYILLFITFFIIFGFSSQDGEKSGGVSQKVTTAVLNSVPQYKQLETNEKQKVFHRTESVIRKIAHFSIYAVVGALLMGITSTYNISNKNRIIISLVVGVIYAGLDEIHQSFSPGRTPKFTDVYIDTLGISLGIIVILLVIKIYNKYLKKSHKMS